MPEKLVPVSKKPSLKKWLWLLVPILLVAVAAGAAYWYFIGSVALTIDGKRYTKHEYQLVMDDALKSGVSNDKAKAQYIGIEKKRAVADKLNVEVDNTGLLESGRSLYDAKYKPLKSVDQLSWWEKEKAYELALENAKRFYEKGGYYFGYFQFPFARHLEYVQIGPTPSPLDVNAKKAQIEDDRKYAQQKANEYHERIKSKTITIEKAISEIQADKRLRFANAGNKTRLYYVDNKGVVATGATGLANVSGATLLPDNTLKNIKGLSDIKTEKEQYFLDRRITEGKPVDVFFYFIDMKKTQSPNPDLPKKFDEALRKLKVKTNV